MRYGPRTGPAYDRVRAAADQVPGAEVDGVLVTTMRSGGTELLAGVTVDPAFGPVLAVGLGGVWVEVLADTALRTLQVNPLRVAGTQIEALDVLVVTGPARDPQ